ncbi:MAG: hypothetical protein ACE5NG_03195 [bacterium]
MFLEIQTHLNGKEKPDRVFVNLKRQAISVSINTFTVYTFDLLGRLVTAFRSGHTFRRSLDNQVMEKWSVSVKGQKKRVRLWLNLNKRRAFLQSIHELFRQLFCLVQQSQFEILATDAKDVDEITQELLVAFDKIQFFDFWRLEKDARRFNSIYRRVGILPPDMYLSILLQATEGCPYNKCDYCTFYKGQAFRIKSEVEFQQHILAVKEYLGNSIPLRKYVFLGEANALDISQSRLISIFDEINKQFIFSEPGVKSDNNSTLPTVQGIYSFLSPFNRNQKSANDFGELRARNLRRVYIGMETGCDELSEFLNKAGKVENLLGAGGDKFYDSHVRETTKAIKEMNLGIGDIVFFSPIIQFPGTAYSNKISAQNICPLTEEEIETQKNDMLKGFGFPRDVNSPKVALYDINEFVY